MTWNDLFLDLHDRCVAFYQGGNLDFETYYSSRDRAFLEEIGCKPREFFDFVEDFCEAGVPSASTALLVAAVRRDYFMAGKGVPGNGEILNRENVPNFGEELEGMAYLPRLIAKARAKLRGELDPDLMFCCGGDRRFLQNHGGIHPADFLRRVWAAGKDDSKIARWVAEQLV